MAGAGGVADGGVADGGVADGGVADGGVVAGGIAAETIGRGEDELDNITIATTTPIIRMNTHQ